MDAVGGALLANFLVLLIGLIAAVAVGIVLHMFVFGPKAKDPNASSTVKFMNGQHFLPLSVIRITYYALAVYLIFVGISKCITGGYTGINGILQYTVLGNIILRIVYEAVLALRKSAGIDTDSNTAEEPKLDKPLVQPRPAVPQYQQPMYQQPAQQYQQPVQPGQPAPMQYQQPAQFQQPAPMPVPAPAPAPAPVHIPTAQPAPIQQQPVASACPGCGKPLKPGAKFCPFCGKSV